MVFKLVQIGILNFRSFGLKKSISSMDDLQMYNNFIVVQPILMNLASFE
jgi:hypothetical protein